MCIYKPVLAWFWTQCQPLNLKRRSPSAPVLVARSILQSVRSAFSEYAAPLIKRNRRIIIARPLRGPLRGLLRGAIRYRTARVWLGVGVSAWAVARC